MKFTQKQINDARKSRAVRVHIDENFDLDGNLSDLQSRIKKYVKDLQVFKNYRWEDGTKIKISELKMATEYVGYDGGFEVSIYAEKIIPEPDERVIRKLDEKAKRAERAEKKKDAQEKRERSLLKTLKEKYKEKA